MSPRSHYGKAIVALSGDELARKLVELEARYTKHAAVFPKAWLDYGEADPLFDHAALLQPCRRCDRPPEQTITPGGHAFACACGAAGEPARNTWRAVLNWNDSPQAAITPWQAYPFFGLANLSLADADAKLTALHRHLALRSELEGARKLVGRETGTGYFQRLRAYLYHCRFVHRLVRAGSAPAA